MNLAEVTQIFLRPSIASGANPVDGMHDIEMQSRVKEGVHMDIHTADPCKISDLTVKLIAVPLPSVYSYPHTHRC